MRKPCTLTGLVYLLFLILVAAVYAADETDTVVFKPAATRDSPASEITGDIDGDGEVGLADVLLAVKVLAGLVPDQAVNMAGEVNGDARIGVAEAGYVFQKIAGLYTTPPEMITIGNRNVDEG